MWQPGRRAGSIDHYYWDSEGHLGYLRRAVFSELESRQIARSKIQYDYYDQAFARKFHPWSMLNPNIDSGLSLDSAVIMTRPR